MSVLFWMKLHYKSIGFVLLCAILGGFYGWHTYTVENLQKDVEKWRGEVQTAQAELAVMRVEREKLEQALAEQQQATADAMQKKTVIYRAVQKEVANDAQTKNWYDSPVPASITELLNASASTSHD